MVDFILSSSSLKPGIELFTTEGFRRTSLLGIVIKQPCLFKNEQRGLSHQVVGERNNPSLIAYPMKRLKNGYDNIIKETCVCQE